MANQLDSKYARLYSVKQDQYGIDPLGDKTLPKLLQIQTYRNHIVTQDERGSPDLIALREYGNQQLWWIIMGYNGIASYKDIVEGTNLRIPTYGSVVTVITENAVSGGNRPQRVITI